MEKLREKFKQKLKTPQVLYAWICLDCHKTGDGRAPHLCPGKDCRSPQVKEIKTEVNTGEVI